MAKLKNVSVSGAATLALPAAAATNPIRKEEFDLEISSLTDADGSLSTLIATLRAEFEGNVAAVLLQLTALANEDETLAQLIIALRAEFEANVASVALQLTALSTADSSLSQLIATLRSDFNANVASVTLQLSALSTSLQTVADARLILEATFNANIATINSRLTALANADGATSTSIQQLIAQSGSNATAITVQAQAMATALGQLYARYAVTLDVNGRVSGFELLNGTGIQSSFIIRADVFGIISPTYPNNTFPSKIMISGPSGSVFHTALGTGAANTFTNVNGVSVSRLANLFVASNLLGVGVGTGYSSYRLRNAGTNTVIVHAAGQCKNLSIWYRVVGVHSDWRIFGALGWAAPTSEAFHFVGGFAQRDITVGAFNELQIGINGLDGNGNGDATDSNNDIYNGSLLIEVVNY